MNNHQRSWHMFRDAYGDMMDFCGLIRVICLFLQKCSKNALGGRVSRFIHVYNASTLLLWGPLSNSSSRDGETSFARSDLGPNQTCDFPWTRSKSFMPLGLHHWMQSIIFIKVS